MSGSTRKQWMLAGWAGTAFIVGGALALPWFAALVTSASARAPLVRWWLDALPATGLIAATLILAWWTVLAGVYLAARIDCPRGKSPTRVPPSCHKSLALSRI